MRFAPLALILAAVAGLVALVASRRRARWRGVLAGPEVPSRIDREAFDGAGASGRDWLVAIFTDGACRTCGSALERLGPLAGPSADVVEVDAALHTELHARYGVNAVPFTLVADRHGTVQAWIIGPPTAADIASVQQVLPPD